MEDHGPQKRAPRKKLRITFPDGDVLPDFIIGTPNLVRGLKVGVVHHE